MDNLCIPVLHWASDCADFCMADPAHFGPEGACVYFHTTQDGWLTRADLKKLRDWINGRLEETKPKPQPGEVWELEGHDGEWLRLPFGWSRVDGNGWTNVGNPLCRVGRIVYDNEE